MYAIRTYNHGEFFYTISAQKLTAHVMKLYPWQSHLFALRYNICDLKIYHGYMYAIRTYNHGEFFYTISARKLTAEVIKLFK